MKTTTLAIPVLLAALSACSLKEDRIECPCWLQTDLSGCTVTKVVTASAWNSERELYREGLTVRDHDVPFERPVPKGMVTTSVTAGEVNMVRHGRQLIILEGNDADSVWAHTARLECRGEIILDSAVLHKQFARVHLRIVNPENNPYPYTLRVRGGVKGFDLQTMEPVEGPFLKALDPSEGGSLLFCLPRQKDAGSLKLEMLKGHEVVDVLPLGRWIVNTGYSWKTVDLEDIYVGVDYARELVTISVNDWETSGSIRVEI